MSILNQRAMVLVKIEGTSGIDASPSPTTDAILVINPMFGADVKMLERKFATRDFSNWPHIAGRKLGTLKFSVEMAGSGVPAAPSVWTRLLQACSMSRATQTGVTRATTTLITTGGVTTVTTGVAHGFVAGNVVNGAGFVGSGGGSFDMNFTVISAPTTTTFTIATSAANGTYSVADGTFSLVSGILFSPLTDNQPSATLYCYYDGLLHKITGAMGTYAIKADSGLIPEIDFTFQGLWSDPINAGSFPSNDAYDTINAPIVEYGALTYFGDTSYVVNAFKFDMGNKIVERADMGAASGFRGVRISQRTPAGGIDPEATIAQAITSFASLTSGGLGAMSLSIGSSANGTVAGHSIIFSAPQVQLSSLVYNDRDNFRVYEHSLAFKRLLGNDEFSLLFA